MSRPCIFFLPLAQPLWIQRLNCFFTKWSSFYQKKNNLKLVLDSASYRNRPFTPNCAAWYVFSVFFQCFIITFYIRHGQSAARQFIFAARQPFFISPNWNRSKYVTSESIKHDKMWKKAQKNFYLRPAMKNNFLIWPASKKVWPPLFYIKLF